LTATGVLFSPQQEMPPERFVIAHPERPDDTPSFWIRRKVRVLLP
jgi:hypothetical protein